MACSSYKYMWDEYDVCYRKSDDKSPHGYDSCYCQGDRSHCPLPDEVDEEIL